MTKEGRIFIYRMVAIGAIALAAGYTLFSGALDRLSSDPMPIKGPLTAERDIVTRQGALTLRFDRNKVTLEGTLNRGTPCVDWQVRVSAPNDTQELFFLVFDRNAFSDLACIQIVGEPQHIYAEAAASRLTRYSLIFEEEEIFRGTLFDRK